MALSRKTPELNTATMADISFLLLTFFLLTSSIGTDQGIARKLPPMPELNQKPADIKDRNVLKVLVNKSDMLLVQGKPGELRNLKETAKIFLSNPQHRQDMPETEERNIPGMGRVVVSKGVISLKNDRGTSYDMYIQVQNELTAAINELRNEISLRRFGIPYKELTDAKQIEAVSQAVPVAISEAEPENVEGK